MREMGVEIVPLSLAEAREGADICHLHWPESALNGRTLGKRLSAVFALFGKLLLAKRKRAKVVWTVHNGSPHEAHCGSCFQMCFYAILNYFVDGKIFLSKHSEKVHPVREKSKIKHEIVYHGHYADYYASVEPDENFLERIGFVREPNLKVLGHYGLIRPYKNTVRLIEEFREHTGEDHRLIVAGKIKIGAEALDAQIREAIGGDARIYYYPKFLEDAELLALLSITDLTVLPYTKLLNSGAALLALSLGSPVLVTSSPSMLELAEVVGGDAVQLIESPDQFGAQMVEVSNGGASGTGLDLELLNWSKLSRKTVSFYQELINQSHAS
jgi:glycosyltransferase involved in cell wall biosynthesis